MKQTVKMVIKNTIFVICGVIMIMSGYFVYSRIMEPETARNVATSRSERVSSYIEDDGIDKNLLRRIDFTTLQQENNEVSRWLYVPDTAIDDVVMQESVVGQYAYDKRDMYHTYNRSGSYLIPATPLNEYGESSVDAHTLILGHRMNSSNGEWQFSHVPSRWGTYDGSINYPYIYVYYPDRAERWRVWAAADTFGNDMMYQTPYRLGSDIYGTLLDHIEAQAHYTTMDKPNRETKTLILSTCHNFHLDDGRFYVASVPDMTYYYDTKTLDVFLT